MAFIYSDKKDNSGKRDGSKGQYNWPKQGTSINELMNMSGIRVFVDATFINTPAFYAFTKMWQMAKVSSTQQRVYYIQASEKTKIAQEYYFLLVSDDYRECTSWADMSANTPRAAHSNIVLLTADASAAQNAQRLAHNEGCYLRWYGMGRDGKLTQIYAPKERAVSGNCQNPVERSSREEDNRAASFQITQEMAPVGRAVKTPDRVPVKGSHIRCNDSGREILLGQPKMTDHISITYETDQQGYFAKIYTEDALAIDLLQKKAERMVQSRIAIPGVCWPTDILEDQYGCFVGILVPESKGVQLTQSIFMGATGLEQNFPQWDKRDLCTVASTILETVTKLHRAGILFGCLNPASIYIKEKDEVYFVDTDNWQIEGYPSLSRNQSFTPPELINTDSEVYLYNMDQDNYQVAILTFMLMMPGKFPYSKGKQGNERDSIEQKLFPFSVGGDMRRTRDAERPSGVWRIAWDHLPYRMCEEFYETFHESGKYSTAGKRPKEKVWVRLVKEFGTALATNEGVDSRSMFPRTFRRDGKRAFVRCSICGQEHPDFYFMRNVTVMGEKIDIWQRGYRVCLPCANGQSDMYFDCKGCGKRYYYTNRTKILHEIGKSEFDFKNQKWCRNCKKLTAKCARCGKEVPVYQMRVFEDRRRNQRMSVCSSCMELLVQEVKSQARERAAWKDEVYTYGVCRICDRRFPITNGEKERCERKGYTLPTHCMAHRKRF